MKGQIKHGKLLAILFLAITVNTLWGNYNNIVEGFLIVSNISSEVIIVIVNSLDILPNFDRGATDNYVN